MAASYNGWPASRDPRKIGINTTWEPVAGHRFPGGIKSGDVQTVFTYLVRALNSRVEPIREYPAGDEWGWYYKPNVNNPSTLSCHSSGTAIDYNATQHPNRVEHTWTVAQSREIHKILDELGGVVRWLEGYDEMHFEIRGTPLQVRAVAKRITNVSPPTPAPIPPPPPLTQEPEMFFAKEAGKSEVFLFEPGRYTHMRTREDLNAIARAAGISAVEATITSATFDALRQGRTLYT